MSLVQSTPVATPSHNPKTQRALLLHGARQRYELTLSHPLPVIKAPNEVIIRVIAIGLNPVDWKSVDYNFGLPTLPAVNGRDLAGEVIEIGEGVNRLKVGDRVFGPSTQYRDYRTSAFQSYAIAYEHCLGVVPPIISIEQASSIGVGAVAAALALGSSLGIKINGFAPRDLAMGAEGEDAAWVREAQSGGDYTEKSSTERITAAITNLSILSSDADETTKIPEDHRGEWILIWGASSVTGFFAAQFASMAGMRVIGVADISRHGKRLESVGVEHVIDRKDVEGTIASIRTITNGGLIYAIDCVNKATAQHAIDCLDRDRPAFVVGLSGLPRIVPKNVTPCTVPIKTFHSNPLVGSALMRVIEDLLVTRKLVLPEIEVHEGGLEAVNDALDRLRRGEVSGGRLVIRADYHPEHDHN